MENFIEKIKSLSSRVTKIQESIQTEEATKTSIIMPFFQMLGYDVFNPEEFVPEFTADVGTKKGEKVDYAIMNSGNPIILIEAKSINEKLDKHDSQLFRYFSTTNAKFAILTNGVHYKFYSDLEEQNKMDRVPFFEINLLDIKDHQITELYKFQKGNFDIDDILNVASELKYSKEIVQYLQMQWVNPSEEFISPILTAIYPGKKTKQVIEKFTPLMKKSMKLFINDLINDKFKAALATTKDEVATTSESEQVSDKKPEPLIVTTNEEIEGYATVKILISGVVEPERVYYRDNQSYLNVLIDDNIRKWVCRLGLEGRKKYIQFNDDNKSSATIETVADIMNYKEKLIEVAKKFA